MRLLQTTCEELRATRDSNPQSVAKFSLQVRFDNPMPWGLYAIWIVGNWSFTFNQIFCDLSLKTFLLNMFLKVVWYSISINHIKVHQVCCDVVSSCLSHAETSNCDVFQCQERIKGYIPSAFDGKQCKVCGDLFW